MEQRNPYPPLVRAPLKMRGVFGLSWQLYKRGFWPMFWFTLLLVGLLVFVFMLAILGTTVDLLRQADTDFAAAATRVSGFLIISFLVFLAACFLIVPAFCGVAFMEMDERMEGRAGTLSQLLRFALPIGFKRFYSTFLSFFAAQVIASIVLSILQGMVDALPMLSAAAKGLHTVGSEAGVGLIITQLCVTIIFSVVNMAVLSLIYPVAAHEGKRAFQAVGRAIRLSFKRFGRILCACALFTLIQVVGGIVCVLLPIQGATSQTVLITGAISFCLWTILVTPYVPAFYTALYVDSAAREADEPANNNSVPSAEPLEQEA